MFSFFVVLWINASCVWSPSLLVGNAGGGGWSVDELGEMVSCSRSSYSLVLL